MRPADNIEKLISNVPIDSNSDVDEAVLNDLFEELDSSKAKYRTTQQACTWRTIMTGRIAKLAVAAVFVAAVIIVLSQLGGSKVAFAKVLEHIRTSGYTFDVKPKYRGAQTIPAMVLRPGRMRLEAPVGLGRISFIIDTTKSESLMLIHQFKAAIVKIPETGSHAEAGLLFTLCTKPIENLWNLKDGTEEDLGVKVIDGQKARGFRVSRKYEDFKYDVVIWANARTGVPILVEITGNPLDGSSESAEFVFDNFELDVELDESLFSLKPPAGYTLTNQKELDELTRGTPKTQTGERIEKLLALWSEGNKQDSVELLLGTDFSADIQFGPKAYFFILTEMDYIALKDADKNRAWEDVSATAKTVRELTRHVVDLGKNAAEEKDYDKAEQYFEAALQCGKILTRNPEGMLIVRLVGIAVEKLALNELISLYATINNREKLKAAKDRLQAVEAQAQEIKSKVSGK